MGKVEESKALVGRIFVLPHKGRVSPKRIHPWKSQGNERQEVLRGEKKLKNLFSAAHPVEPKYS